MEKPNAVLLDLEAMESKCFPDDGPRLPPEPEELRSLFAEIRRLRAPQPNAGLREAILEFIEGNKAQHSMACTYPEGCSCGASQQIAVCDSIAAKVRALLPGSDNTHDPFCPCPNCVNPDEVGSDRGLQDAAYAIIDRAGLPSMEGKYKQHQEAMCLVPAKLITNLQRLCPFIQGSDKGEAKVTALTEALDAFLKFGRPREGSDRYHAAWDALKTVMDAK